MPLDSLDLLKMIAPPPASPRETGTEQGWAETERILGLALPQDYKRLIAAYATGSFDDFLWVLNPFAGNRFLNLMERRDMTLDAYESAWQLAPGQRSFLAHLRAGDLLAWGITDNGDEMYWRTGGVPDGWPTVLNESRGPLCEVHELPATGFLVRLLSGEVQTEVFPADFLEERERRFVPLG